MFVDIHPVQCLCRCFVMFIFSKEKHLYISENLEFVNRPTDTSIGIGQNASFDCKIKGGKNPEISWKHAGIWHVIPEEGEKTDEGSSRMYINKADNTFVITDVKAIDTGPVICLVHDWDLYVKYKHPVQFTVLRKFYIFTILFLGTFLFFFIDC